MAKKVTKKKASTTTKKKATKKKSTKQSAKTAGTPVMPEVTEDEIRVRAFEIYCSGRNPSDPDADWLEAERELRAQIAS